MPTTTQLKDGSTVISYTGKEMMESARLSAEVARRMGRDEDIEKDPLHPSIQRVAQVVAWAFAYAPESAPLNESHPLWGEFFPQSEWFRCLIIAELGLQPNTTWDDIYRLSGFLIEEEYESEEKFLEAHHYGEMTLLQHPDASRKLEELGQTKYAIVGRY